MPNQQPPRPTGDLEHLFQQKFAEAEVAPRASFWDQLDHELVVQQHEQVVQENTTYRRRLVLHRWVAAACLLLALGFGSWAYLGPQGLGSGPELAATTSETRADGQTAATQPGFSDASDSQEGRAMATRQPQQLASIGGATASENLLATTGAGELTADQLPGVADSRFSAATTASTGSLGNTADAMAAAAGAANGYSYASNRYVNTVANLLVGTRTNGAVAESNGFSEAGLLSPRAAYLRSLLRARRPDTLKPALLALPQAPAEAVAATTQEQKETPRLWKRLRLGGSYTAGAFSPNINFSRTDGRVKSDPVTTALRTYYQDEAENEYRRNLRAGFSQRVAFNASYALNNHWTLTTGAEAAEQRATSATSYSFIDGKQVGPQAADIFSRPAAYNAAPAQPRTTTYRYRSVAVPVSVRYGSSKAGLSLYAKVGAAVSVLLNSRSELEGAPEATRNYTAKSTDSPYRQVLTSARGGAGIRYQPASSGWSLAVGPVAEAYFTTLNAHPSQRVINQSRPYSLGVEASVEFGTPKPMPGVQ